MGDLGKVIGSGGVELFRFPCLPQAVSFSRFLSRVYVLQVLPLARLDGWMPEGISLSISLLCVAGAPPSRLVGARIALICVALVCATFLCTMFGLMLCRPLPALPTRPGAWVLLPSRASCVGSSSSGPALLPPAWTGAWPAFLQPYAVSFRWALFTASSSYF